MKNRIHLPFAAQHQDPCDFKRGVCEIKLTECRKTSTVRMSNLLLLGPECSKMNKMGAPNNDKN